MSERDLNAAIAELAASVPNGELLAATDAPEFLRAVRRQLNAANERAEKVVADNAAMLLLLKEVHNAPVCLPGTRPGQPILDELAQLRACLTDIGDIAYDRDGCGTVESLGRLVDEIRLLARSGKPLPRKAAKEQP